MPYDALTQIESVRNQHKFCGRTSIIKVHTLLTADMGTNIKFVMKAIVTKNFILVFGFMTLSGCTMISLLDDCGNPMGAGAPEVNKDGKFADSPNNRQHFENGVNNRINREKNDLLPGHDWKQAWHLTFRSIDQSSENPKYKKNYIIAKRREAGLPIWAFMLE